jgi:predicted nucleotidyltransferase
MNSGLSENAAAQIRGALGRHPEVEKAVLYGSRAKGNYKPGSDVDLTLLGAGLTQTVLGQIQGDLEDGLLPYRFDLSILERITHDGLLDHIRRVGVVFYERQPAPDQSRS